MKTECDKPKCEKCGSYYVYVTEKEIVCRRCGFRKKKVIKK